MILKGNSELTLKDKDSDMQKDGSALQTKGKQGEDPEVRKAWKVRECRTI